ncbi:hypothetical protein FB451DRAFT_1289534 [Mycena latifolia]|nr:hypothetical protein FB451DRAFT_1289534 [Mycena latifolia]
MRGEQTAAAIFESSIFLPSVVLILLPSLRCAVRPFLTHGIPLSFNQLYMWILRHHSTVDTPFILCTCIPFGAVFRCTSTYLWIHLPMPHLYILRTSFYFRVSFWSVL